MHIWNSSPGADRTNGNEWMFLWGEHIVDGGKAQAGAQNINSIQEAVRQHRTAHSSHCHAPVLAAWRWRTVLRLWIKGPAYTTARPWVRTVIESIYLQNQPWTYLFIWRVQKNVLTQEHEKCIKWESCGFTMSLEKATNITFYISCNI